MKKSGIRRTRCAECAALAGLMLLTACQGPLRPDERAILRAASDQTDDLGPFAPREFARNQPRTLEEILAQANEQAITGAIDEMMESPQESNIISLTLEEVRAAALQNNLDLKVELFNPAISEEQLNQERAKFEWVAFGSASTSKTDSPVVLSTESSQADFDRFNIGLQMPMSSGGTVTIEVPFSSQSSNNPFSTLNPAYNADARFSISQPLLRNAWERTNTYSIRVAEFEREIVDAQTKLEAIRVLANADRAYWNLYAARRELEVRFQEYQLAMEQLERARRRVEAGDVAELEVTRAQSGAAQSLELIIVAKSNLERRQRDLKRIMNRPDLQMGSMTSIIPSTQPAPLELDLDIEQLAAFATINRMEMLELELQLAIDASTIDLRDNARLPLLTLDYTYNFGGLGSSYGDAFDQVGEVRFQDWSLGVTAEVPIGNEQAKAAYHQAVLQRLQRLATKAQREQAIEQEVRDAVDQFDQEWQRILAASIEARLAGETYEGEQRQFDVGVRTSTDVLDAAARLSDAQSREARALADYQIALIDLAFATGTLLGHDNIVWPEALPESTN